MAYVPTDDLKRMSNMLLNNAEIIASNYCFAFNHDEPGDEEEVTSQLLKFFGEKIRETELELLEKQGCRVEEGSGEE